MDFWSRLIGGLAASSNKQSYNNRPQQRLAYFKKAYGKLLNTWQAASGLLARDYVATETTRKCLRDIAKILDDELRLPAPHLCLSAACTWQIYQTISIVATSVDDVVIIDQTIDIFNSLADSEQDEFVSSIAFAKSLMNFAEHVAGPNGIFASEDLVTKIVELLFGIATKIRLQPELLPAWFAFSNEEPEGQEESSQNERARFVGARHQDDFQLFYLLRDLWHHEGKIGEFSRMGVLYMIEAASHSDDLERWIVESDLATLMASGLGAQYSQLSRKSEYPIPPSQLPPLVLFSDHKIIPYSEQDEFELEEFQGHMQTFLQHLMFWQDVLEHCPSIDVKQNLLDHFQALFLKQLLYPSLLESSDFDGGSQAAVLNYLRQILEAIDHPDLVHSILHYLLALPDEPKPKALSSVAKRRVRESRRKSLELLSLMTQKEDEDSPTLFTLVDLIQGSLRSESQQTISATLKLVSTILRKFHRYSIFTLVKVLPVAPEPQRTFGALSAELELLMGLAESICPDEELDKSYEDHLKDNLNVIENHGCTAQFMANHFDEVHQVKREIPGPKDVIAHRLVSEDPLLRSLVSLLGSFFTNSVEVNLSLTGTIIALASCMHMHLEGWLLVNPSAYEYADDHEDEREDEHSSSDIEEDELDAQMKELDELLLSAEDSADVAHLNAVKKVRLRPTWSKDRTPPIIARLQELAGKVDAWKLEIPNFETLLSQRRVIFFPVARPTEEKPPMNPWSRRSEVFFNRPLAPQNLARISLMEPLSQHIFGDDISRSTSPRGRPLRQNDQDGLRNISFNRLSVATPTSPRSHSSSRMIGPGLTRSQTSVKRTFSARHHRQRSEPSWGEELLKRKVRVTGSDSRDRASSVLSQQSTDGAAQAVEESQHGSVNSGSDEAGEAGTKVVEKPTKGKVQSDDTSEGQEVTLNHILTNTILLQEFILELAALIQVRASLFREVKFV